MYNKKIIIDENTNIVREVTLTLETPTKVNDQWQFNDGCVIQLLSNKEAYPHWCVKVVSERGKIVVTHNPRSGQHHIAYSRQAVEAKRLFDAVVLHYEAKSYENSHGTEAALQKFGVEGGWKRELPTNPFEK